MADLTCARCSATVADGAAVCDCGNILTLPGAVLIAEESSGGAGSQAEQCGDGARPAKRDCSSPGCSEPARRGRSLCEVHDAMRQRGQHRSFRLLAQPGNWEVVVDDGQSVGVGRNPDFSIHAATLDGAKFVSGRHLILRSTNGVLVVRDLHSRNGTRVNGRRISPDESVPLVSGDCLSLGGQITLVVR